MKFQCLHCGQHYEIDDAFAGRSVNCKSCSNVMKVPIPLGNSVILNPDELRISNEEVIAQNRRRRQHRYWRRILLVLVSLLVGAVVGGMSIIMINTSNTADRSGDQSAVRE